MTTAISPIETARTELEHSGCLHCGLATRADASYCCYGCELAAQIAEEASRDHSRTRNTLTFGLLLTMSVMMLSLFLYAEDIYGEAAAADLGWMRAFYRYASAFLATPVLALCGLPLTRHALSRLREGRLSMSALIALGAFAAYGLSIANLAIGRDAIYFDSATAALVLATLGRYLEATARTHAAGLVASRASSLGSYDVEGRGSLPAAQLVRGMQLRVPAETTVPVDLRLLEGPVEIDAGILSGESRPKTMNAGDVVPSGAVPVDTAAIGVATADANLSTLERLSALAKSLGERPSELLRIADRFAAFLTPVVWAIAIATFTLWTITAGVEVGVSNALAVVLVACPCTYAIAAPLVHWLALRRSLADGATIRSAEALEQLARVDLVAFDKTGTLTRPDLTVSAVELLEAENEVRRLVAALEAETRHPVGRALLAWAGDDAAPLTDRRQIVGVGVEGTDADGRRHRLARTDDERIALTRDDEVLARFTVAEETREEAKEALEALASLGVETKILTGDAAGRAERVAKKLDLPFAAELSPAQKVERIGDRHAAMVGDGLNDAPALAKAVGIAMPLGTDLSRGISQVVLQHDDLRLVPFVLELARNATVTTRRLLTYATAYNVVFIAMAAGGLLRPVWAGVSMLISSLLTLAVAAQGTET